MNSKLMPPAITFLHKQNNAKRENLRNFIGLKQHKDPNAGLYGMNFFPESQPDDMSNYVPCLEKGCSFRGPLHLIELHNKTIHEMGLEKEINIDDDTWIKNRKRNFPSSSKDKKVNQDNKTEIDSNTKQSKNKFNDVLGLCEAYGSTDEDEVVEKRDVDAAYLGLPLIEELTPKQLKRRMNKFKFPILPQMELSERRRALMNPSRRYDNRNKKAKRPRLQEILCADELISEKNFVLQCVRYLCNKRFFDPSLINVSTESVIENPVNQSNKNIIEEDADIFKIEEAVSDDEADNVWSDCEL